MWGCGLKPPEVAATQRHGCVTPYVGVWIETQYTGLLPSLFCVTPYVGVWIETHFRGSSGGKQESPPMWGCGLKLSKKEV